MKFLADVRVLLDRLQNELKSIKDDSTGNSTNSANRAASTAPTGVIISSHLHAVANDTRSKTAVSKVTMKVHQTINEVAKRKNDVIISGLPEMDTQNDNDIEAADENAFLQLYEEHLSLEPMLAEQGCIRLGK
jgi:hypothetical protein